MHEEDKRSTINNYSWYGNELILNKKPRYTRSEQMKILDTHPFFKGLCLEYGYKFSEDYGFVDCKCPARG